MTSAVDVRIVVIVASENEASNSTPAPCAKGQSGWCLRWVLA